VDNIKFTIVTVVYNGEKTIRRTIESVLNQSYVPFEYLIVDGLSSDNTVSIAREYESFFLNKGVSYKIISEKDSGIYNAMNKGIELAQGDFIAFLNAGDWYELDALKSISEFCSAKDFDLIYGSINYVKPNGKVRVKKSKLDYCVISSRNWNHPSMFLKTSLYKTYGFDENFKTYADFALYLKLRKTHVRIGIIDKVITNFVADGLSTDSGLKQVMKRASEKYDAYRVNGYSCLYWIESYFWEIAKAVYLGVINGSKGTAKEVVKVS